ncbi:hypothetical protein GQ55_3G177400 [Panicum hallii var. hallii]|jgi:hypothetical protein|uniref:Uncharacterized protein n=1 Tax=Panicum hallii var. hallii TaxID=1504633 RepID=A0A2T7EAK5_9POAL|nr:hypothetical protein GQ55_3G177400 [Panicum hallii var. hallii]
MQPLHSQLGTASTNIIITSLRGPLRSPGIASTHLAKHTASDPLRIAEAEKKRAEKKRREK